MTRRSDLDRPRIAAMVAAVNGLLLDHAGASVEAAVAVEAACARTFVELCVARNAGQRTVSPTNRAGMQAAVREQFEAVLAGMLPQCLDRTAVADVIADSELAAERRQRS